MLRAMFSAGALGVFILRKGFVLMLSRVGRSVSNLLVAGTALLAGLLEPPVAGVSVPIPEAVEQEHPRGSKVPNSECLAPTILMIPYTEFQSPPYTGTWTFWAQVFLRARLTM